LRLGVLGGTFDPIHNGHMKIAEIAFERLKLDKLLFVPNGNPPHKSDTFSLPEQRVDMVRKAIENIPGYELEEYEQWSKKFSYTYRTLSYLNEKYKNPEMFFISGADNIKWIEQWKRPDIIFRLAKVAFVKRPGYELDVSFSYADRAVFIEYPGVEISSTSIRNKIMKGKDISKLVPGAVAEYIRENHLYKYDEYKSRLKGYINPKRYAHSLNVADEAVRLARKYGVDEEKAYLAGLMHDCAKDVDIADQLELIENYSEFPIMTDELAFPKVVHALTGSVIAKRDFKITDPEILSAIRFHTLGNVEMKPLDKIIYVADIIEKSRTYEGVENLRKLAYESINKTIIASIESTVSFLGEKKIQKDVLLLKEYLKERENELI